MPFNKFLHLFIFFIFSCLFTAFSYAEVSMPYAPTPSWVDELDWAQTQDTPVGQVSGGTYYQAFERQFLVPSNAAAQQQYFAYLIKLTNSEGIESNGQISINYDPSFERLEIHRIAIIRNGALREQNENVKFSLLQREEDLEGLIYDGRLTANIILNDVRVGDTLFYSYSVTGSNPILGGFFSYIAQLGWSEPVGFHKTRIVWNKKTPLNVRQLGEEYDVKKSTTSLGDEYVIALRATNAILNDSETPSWYSPYPKIIFSESARWSEIVNWAMPLYATAYEKNTFIELLAKKIDAQAETPEEKISLALQKVQRDIRYLGIEIGVNSHLPSTPAETLSRGWGDCKDKAVLLISLLQYLGFDAYPALVNTQFKQRLQDYGPAINLFNHVIVALEYQGEVFWLDPTLSDQTGVLPDIYQPQYAQALIIKNKNDALTVMPDVQPIIHQEITESFNVRQDVTAPIKYQINTLFKGRNAENTRSDLAKKSAKKIQKYYREFYENYYPKLKVESPLEVHDDKSKNIITTKESYVIDGFWEKDDDGSQYSGSIYFSNFYTYLSKPDIKQRSSPYRWSHPVQISNTIFITFERDDWSFENTEEKVNNPFFTLTRKVDFNTQEKKLTITATLITKQDYIAANDMEAYLNERDKSLDLLYFGLIIPISTNDQAQNGSLLNYNSEFIYLIIAGGFLCVGLILSIVLWVIEERKSISPSGQIYYPVSPVKFILLSILTLEIYSLFWLFKNWSYIRNASLINASGSNNENAPIEQARISGLERISPFWRAFFNIFWFYSLSKIMINASSKDEFTKKKALFLAAVLAVAFAALQVANQLIDSLWWLSILGVLFLLPMLFYINALNKQHAPTAIGHNSEFRWRYIFALPAVMVVYTLMISDALIFVPSEVISGDKVPHYHVRFLKKKKVLAPNETIQQFYSTAIFNWKNDGNGFTENSVFSYWQEGDVFEFEKVNFSEITKIETQDEDSDDANTTINIYLQDGSHFVLFAAKPTNDKDDFVKNLMTKWKAYSG